MCLIYNPSFIHVSEIGKKLWHGQGIIGRRRRGDIIFVLLSFVKLSYAVKKKSFRKNNPMFSYSVSHGIISFGVSST